MTNRSSSKQHGLVGKKWPKSKLRKRANKAKSNAKKAATRHARREACLAL